MTCLKHWGVKNASESKLIRDKIRQSIKSDEVQNKIIKTCIETYGVRYPMQNPEVRRKYNQTMNMKYGHDSYSQTLEYHKNKRHEYRSEKYPSLTFDSTWEVTLYEFCRDNNIPVEYSPSISYNYEYDGRICTYHPDFLISGKVYEVKGE